MNPEDLSANNSLILSTHHGLRRLGREDFKVADYNGLRRCLKRDPFRPSMKDVKQWLEEGEMTMWRLGKFGMLLQVADRGQSLCLCYIWGENLLGHWEEILHGLEALVKLLGLKYVTSTFASRRLLRVFPGAKVAYYYGMHEVK